jgi:endoglucanase
MPGHNRKSETILLPILLLLIFKGLSCIFENRYMEGVNWSTGWYTSFHTKVWNIWIPCLKQYHDSFMAGEYFNRYLVNSAKSKGMIPVYWDNGAPDFSIFNRTSGAVTDQGVVNGIMQGAGYHFYLKNRATNLQIDGMYRSTNGDNCGQWAGGGSDAQQWTIETVDSYIKFKNRASGLYLDGMGRTTNGSDLGQWANSSSFNQQWMATMVPNSQARMDVTSQPLPVNTNAGETAFNVYPNPFSSTTKLTIGDPENITLIKIFDMTGRLVETIRPSGRNYVELGAKLRPNAYLVKIFGVNRMQTFKIIKSR